MIVFTFFVARSSQITDKCRSLRWIHSIRILYFGILLVVSLLFTIQMNTILIPRLHSIIKILNECIGKCLVFMRAVYSAHWIVRKWHDFVGEHTLCASKIANKKHNKTNVVNSAPLIIEIQYPHSDPYWCPFYSRPLLVALAAPSSSFSSRRRKFW